MSQEEVENYSESLNKYSNEPVSVVKVLRELEKSSVPTEFLKSTRIGKRLTAITEDKNDYDGDESLLKEIITLKKHIKETWLVAYKL